MGSSKDGDLRKWILGDDKQQNHQYFVLDSAC